MDKYDKIDFGAGQNTNSGDTLYDAFSKVNNAFDNIENDINAVDTKLDDFIDKVEVDVAELDALINDLDDKKADKSELDAEIIRIDNDINNLNVELTNTNNSIIDLTNDVDDKLDLKADKSELNSEILRIDNSIIDLTNDVDDKLALKADKSELDAEIIRIDNSIIDLTNDVDDKLALKADKLTTYTKVEVDNLITNVEVDLTDYYNKTEIDLNLSNYYTKNLTYNQSQINQFLNTKANQSDVYMKVDTYSKTEVDDLIANSGGGGEVDLTNYYTKTEVDTKLVFGENAVANIKSVAMGVDVKANGGWSVAIGETAKTTGTNSVAIGRVANATGANSVATGIASISRGINSVAIGPNANASANNSIAIGNYTTSHAYGGITLGQNNDPILTSAQTTFNAEHPLFIIGNGTSSSAKNNAFVMLQNGKSEFTNVANYKEDYSAEFLDNSLVNKKYVDDLVANNSGGGGETDLSNYYTKTEVDTELSSSAHAQITYVDNQLNLKADKLTTYTKVEVDGLIDNIDFPTTDLSNYYTKTETYNKSEVDDLVANSGGGGSDLSNYYTKSEVNLRLYDTKVRFGQNSTGSGTNSVSIGFWAEASGTNSVGIGYFPKARGTNSVAIGNSTQAHGDSAIAIGRSTIGGEFGTSIGNYTTSNAYGGIAIGRYNDPILSAPQYEFNLEHPLFIIGNGTSNSDRKNAFVMLQNGKSEFTNIASYKEDYSASFLDNSLVNKKYVDDLVANNSGEIVGELVTLSNSSTVDITWNNDIVICDSATDFEILVPAGLGNLSFVVRNIGEGNVTLTTDGTSYLHTTSSGQIIETGQITSVIINNNLIISTGTL